MTAKGASDETKREAIADDATRDNVLHAKDNINFPATSATERRLKRSGMDFFTMTLGSPKYVVSALAPDSPYFTVPFVISCIFFATLHAWMDVPH